MISAVVSVESKSGRVHLERLCACPPEGLPEPQREELTRLAEELAQQYGERRAVRWGTAPNFLTLFRDVTTRQ